MLVYQSGEAAIQLFSGDSPEARKILGAALPALATQGDYKVIILRQSFRTHGVRSSNSNGFYV